MEAFFEIAGNRAIPSPLTSGPWDENAQHGGATAALLGRLIEQCEARDGFFVARVTVEILGPVPVAPLDVNARVARSGRNVDLIEATLRADGKDRAKAMAWRMVASTSPDGAADDPYPAQPGPDTVERCPLSIFPDRPGYWTGMDWRFARGSFFEAGPALSWLRMLVPLIAGEEPSPLVRTLIAADVGNGISNVLDFQKYYYINTDLTVHLQRVLEGEWVGVDARSIMRRGGAGLAESVLSDTAGPIGRGAQTLFVSERA